MQVALAFVMPGNRDKPAFFRSAEGVDKGLVKGVSQPLPIRTEDAFRYAGIENGRESALLFDSPERCFCERLNAGRSAAAWARAVKRSLR